MYACKSCDLSGDISAGLRHPTSWVAATFDQQSRDIIMPPVALSPPKAVDKSLKQAAMIPEMPLESPKKIKEQSISLHPETKAIRNSYNKATQSFLLREYDTTWTHVTTALDQLREFDISVVDGVLMRKAWVLFVSLVGAVLSQRQQGKRVKLANGRGSLGAYTAQGPEQVMKSLWSTCVDAYGGVEGHVDGSVVVANILVELNVHQVELARSVVEGWLGTLSEFVLTFLEEHSGDDDEISMAYERVVELYILHVLPKLGEYEYAREFLNFNSILTEDKKRIYSDALDKVHERSLRQKEAKKRQAQQTTKRIKEEELQTNLASSVHSLKDETLKPSDSISDLKQSIPTIPSSSSKTPFSSSKAPSAPVAKRNTGKVSAHKSKSFSDMIREMVSHYIEQLSRTSGTARVIAFTIFLTLMSATAAAQSRQKLRELLKAIWGKLLQTVAMGTKVTYV